MAPWPKVRSTAKGGGTASPFDGSLIWGKTKQRKHASRSSRRVGHMCTTVTCRSLIAVRLGRASSAPLTRVRPLYTSEERAWLSSSSACSSAGNHSVKHLGLSYPLHSKTHLNALPSRHWSLFTTGFLEMVKRPQTRRSWGNVARRSLVVGGRRSSTQFRGNSNLTISQGEAFFNPIPSWFGYDWDLLENLKSLGRLGSQLRILGVRLV